MNIEEYKKRIKAIDDEAIVKKKSLGVEYAMSHNSIAIDNVIEDHIGRIKVEKISVQIISSGNVPVCVYLGYTEGADLRSSDWARQYVNINPSHEPMVDGKRVYVVAQDSHLAVA